MKTRMLKFKKRTAQVIFEPDHNIEWSLEDMRQIVALLLLTGMYNPLRAYTNNDTPIDLKELEAYKDRFNALIDDVNHAMKISVTEIDRIA